MTTTQYLRPNPLKIQIRKGKEVQHSNPISNHFCRPIKNESHHAILIVQESCYSHPLFVCLHGVYHLPTPQPRGGTMSCPTLQEGQVPQWEDQQPTVQQGQRAAIWISKGNFSTCKTHQNLRFLLKKIWNISAFIIENLKHWGFSGENLQMWGFQWRVYLNLMQNQVNRPGN